MYTPETSCMKRTSVHIKNTWIKQCCNRKVRDFAMAFRAWKVSGAFEKRAPGICFSKGPETFRACKAIFGWSFSKTRELCTPETSWMKRTSVHLKNMWITQLCNHNVRDFATAFRVPKLFGTFEKRAPSQWLDIARYEDSRHVFWLANCEFEYSKNRYRLFQDMKPHLWNKIVLISILICDWQLPSVCIFAGALSFAVTLRSGRLSKVACFFHFLFRLWKDGSLCERGTPYQGRKH